MRINMNNSVVAWIAGGLFVLLITVAGWAYAGVDNRLTKLETRYDNIQSDLSSIRSDVSYIRGRLEPPLVNED